MERVKEQGKTIVLRGAEGENEIFRERVRKSGTQKLAAPQKRAPTAGIFQKLKKGARVVHKDDDVILGTVAADYDPGAEEKIHITWDFDGVTQALPAAFAGDISLTDRPRSDVTKVKAGQWIILNSGGEKYAKYRLAGENS